MREVTDFPFLSEPTHEETATGHMIRVPFVEGEIACSFDADRTNDFGIMSLHNKLGSNKSIVLPLLVEKGISTIMVPTDSSAAEYDEGWFRNALNACQPAPVKAVKTAFDALVEEGRDHLSFLRCYQVNVMAQLGKDGKIVEKGDRLHSFTYEILTGVHMRDGAENRCEVPMWDFKGNGHVVEALVSRALCPTFGAEEFDMPYSVARELRWLGSQYLRKMTRGNFFPQINPIIDEIVRRIESDMMRGSNEEWGALSALSAVIGGR